MTEEIEWATLSPEEQRKQLFLKQKRTLDTFLEKNAISQAQYDKSLGICEIRWGWTGKVSCKTIRLF